MTLDINKKIDTCKQAELNVMMNEEHLFDMLAENDVPECYEEYTFNDDTDSCCNNQTSNCDHNCPMYRDGYDS